MCNSFCSGMKNCGCTMSYVGKVLLIIGGLNWGLIGIGALLGNMDGSWNLVYMIFGSMPTLEAIIYLLVGISAVVSIFGCKCKKCSSCVCTSCNTSDMDKKM